MNIFNGLKAQIEVTPGKFSLQVVEKEVSEEKVARIREEMRR